MDDGEPTYIGPLGGAVQPRGPLARRVTLAPLARITRAHLALQQRPAAASECRAALLAVAEQLTRRLGAPVRLEARLLDTSLQPVGQLQRLGAFAVLELAGEALAVLELEPVALGALLGRAAGTEAPRAGLLGLTRIEEAALGALVLSALSTLRGQAGLLGRWAPRLVAVYQDRRAVLEHVDARRRHLAVQVAVHLDGEAGLARLLVPAGWLKASLAALPSPGPGAAAPEVAAAEVSLAPRLGTMTLGRAELRAVGPGDVLLFPGVTAAQGRLRGQGRLLGSALEAQGTFGDAGLTLTRAFERLPPECTVSQADPAAAVEVEIELTRLRVPLHQLGTLQPGAVVPLHLDAAQTVLLRVGDRAVARAELVEVEGEIGARILQLLSRPA